MKLSKNKKRILISLIVIFTISFYFAYSKYRVERNWYQLEQQILTMNGNFSRMDLAIHPKIANVLEDVLEFSGLPTHILYEMKGITCLNGTVTDEFLQLVPKSDSFEYLWFENTNLTDEAIPCFLKYPETTQLMLRNMDISGTHFELLKDLKKLKLLILSGSKISDEAVRKISKFPNLKQLDLDNTLISDKAISYLANSDSIQILNLQNTKITDDCVEDLLSIKNLHLLDLKGTGISPRNRRKLLNHTKQEKEVPLVARTVIN